MTGRRASTGRRNAAPWLPAIAVGTALVLAPAAAGAYCRSTTCSGNCALDANGCKTEGAPLYWSSMCVGFSLQRDGSVNIAYPEVERVTNESFVAWADLECATGFASLAFSRLSDVSCHIAEYNTSGGNANVVMFQDSRWDYTGEFNTLAKTTVTYDNDTGEILDADIELNHAFNEFTTTDANVVYDLQSILTHEIGHFVGVDHSDDFYATMTPGYDQGSIDLRSLEQDDIDAVCAIYPPERDAVCATSPKGGLGDACLSVAPVGEEESGCAVTHRPPGSPAHGTAWAWWLVPLALGGGRALRRAARAGSRHAR